jgi:hypothetical protein
VPRLLNSTLKNKGQAASVFSLLFAFAVLMIGFMAVEISRYCLACDQLKGILEATALCCQTSLQSTGNANDLGNESVAQQLALKILQQNSILGQPLSSAIIIPPTDQQSVPQFDVPPGETQICFQFLDPLTHLPSNSSGNIQNTSSAQSFGTLIRVTGAHGYMPFFTQLVGLGAAELTVQTSVTSGIPNLDLVLVYDVSGAENQQTPVTYFQRYWHDPYGVSYVLPSPTGTPPTNTAPGGPLGPFCITSVPNQGPNPLMPMFLDNGKKCSSPQLNYSELSGNATQLLTGAQAYAAPPGNYPPPQYIWGFSFSSTNGPNNTLVQGFFPIPRL